MGTGSESKDNASTQWKAAFAPIEAADRAAIEVFLDTLADHVAEPWTLGSMAEECGVARTRFAHHCKAITNATPMEYLRRIRIAHAAALLTTRPDLSITEICFASGFSSSQYFATVFRREQAISPSAYRARIASR